MKRLALLGLLACPALAAAAGTVYQSRHNLSATGPGAVKSTSEPRACVFCHSAHRGDRGSEKAKAPHLPLVQPYQSSTMASRAPPGVVGAARSCLSCHDGTVAVGRTLFGPTPMVGAGAGGRLPLGKANMGTDLSRSHPVSFQPAPSRKIRPPKPGDEVQLDKEGRVQCTSCHDPHSEDNDPRSRTFLLRSNRAGSLCLSCHLLPEWGANPASHQSSTAPLRLEGQATFTSMLEGGCNACHVPHGAAGPQLLKADRALGDDRLCLGCHDGRAARLDVARDMAKLSTHSVPGSGPSSHDAAEGPDSAAARLPETSVTQRRHATCVDCHDPHAAYPRQVPAPRAGGILAGVWGIDRNGLKVDPANFEYEICFKCHADSVNQPARRGLGQPGLPRRAFPESNLRRAFDTASPSYHPVTAPGKNPSVPGLLLGLNAQSQIFCTDCHSSDGAVSGGARGPHGSIFQPLLERNYATADLSADSPASYALCYKCHDRDVLRSDRSGFTLRPAAAPARPLHRIHLDRGTPCSACHSAHGVSAASGAAQSGAHLMDFDVDIVAPNARGLRRYTSLGTGHGSCAVACHGVQHDDLGY